MPRRIKSQLPPLYNENNETIGQRLAKYRKRKGMTQKQLAEIIGIQRTLVTEYETGRLHMNDEMIIRFALALGVSSDEILGLRGTEVKEPTPSLKITKRIKKIEELSPQDQKRVLQNLDLILAGLEKTKD